MIQPPSPSTMGAQPHRVPFLTTETAIRKNQVNERSDRLAQEEGVKREMTRSIAPLTSLRTTPAPPRGRLPSEGPLHPSPPEGGGGVYCHRTRTIVRMKMEAHTS